MKDEDINIRTWLLLGFCIIILSLSLYNYHQVSHMVPVDTLQTTSVFNKAVLANAKQITLLWKIRNRAERTTFGDRTDYFGGNGIDDTIPTMTFRHIDTAIYIRGRSGDWYKCVEDTVKGELLWLITTEMSGGVRDDPCLEIIKGFSNGIGLEIKGSVNQNKTGR